jgi:hypothetical protein
MKLIIYDQLRRHWLSWTSCSLMFLMLGAMLPELKDSYLFMGYFLIVFPDSFRSELRDGYARMALSLPLTARQIGRTFWWLSVGLLSLSMFLFSGLGMLIRNSHLRDTYNVSRLWFHVVLIVSLFFGSGFWIFSGAPARSAKDWKKNLPRQIYGVAFFGLLIGGGYLLCAIAFSFETKFLIVSSFCAILAILGWQRAEGLVVDHGRNRQEMSDSGTLEEFTKPISGYGGIRFLVAKLSVRFMSATIFVAVSGIGLAALLDSKRSNWWNISYLYSPLANLFYVVLITAFITSIISHLKFLRVLPLTSRQLGATLIGFTVLPVLIFGTVLALLIFPCAGVVGSLSVFKTYVLFLPPAFVLAIALVWNPERRWLGIIGVVIVVFISALPFIVQASCSSYIIEHSEKGHQTVADIPYWIVIGFPALSFPVAILMISRLLERNSMTYRSRS